MAVTPTTPTQVPLTLMGMSISDLAPPSPDRSRAVPETSSTRKKNEQEHKESASSETATPKAPEPIQGPSATAREAPSQR